MTNLYRRAGLIRAGKKATSPQLSTTRQPEQRYSLRAHSLRYYFRTQLTALGVNPEYAEFMMGHKGALYNDIKMKGDDFLRQIYAKAALSIRPKTAASKMDMVKEVLKSFGYDPDKILVREAMGEAHRAVSTPGLGGQGDLEALYGVLREAVVTAVQQQPAKVNPMPALA